MFIFTLISCLLKKIKYLLETRTKSWFLLRLEMYRLTKPHLAASVKYKVRLILKQRMILCVHALDGWARCVVNLCMGRAVRHVRPSLDALYSRRRQIWNTPNGNKAASLVSAAMRFVTNNERKAPRGTRPATKSEGRDLWIPKQGSKPPPLARSPARLLYFYLRNVDSRRRLFLNTLRASESRSYEFNSRRPSCPAAAHTTDVPRGPATQSARCDLLSLSCSRLQLCFQEEIYWTGNYFLL
jgi:hypothetical protein